MRDGSQSLESETLKSENVELEMPECWIRTQLKERQVRYENNLTHELATLVRVRSPPRFTFSNTDLQNWNDEPISESECWVEMVTLQSKVNISGSTRECK